MSGGARPPRLGFAGLGWIGLHRLDSLARTPGAAEIVAVADPDPACRARARAIAPAARALVDYDALLACALDGVVIATPNALHGEQVERALARGLAVFCQKPLATTAADTARLVAAARRADRDLDVDLSYRHVRAMRAVRRLVRSGAIGAVYAADLAFHNAYGPDKAWFADRRLAGGGCLLDLGTHLADLLLWTLEFPALTGVSARVFAGGQPLRGAEAVEDHVIAQLDLAGGIVARLACSWHLSAGCDAVIEASFYGTGGRATLRNVDGSFHDFVAEEAHGTRAAVIEDGPDAWGGGALLAWAQRLATGGRFRPETGELIAVARLLDAIYEADAAPPALHDRAQQAM